MADEAIIINNPTSIPEAVSTGYQRQNTRSEAASNGIDRSVVVNGVDAEDVILKTGGPVDYNGVLYSLGSDVTFTLTTAGRYYIYLEGTESAANLTPTIGTDSGTFDETKNGRYLSTGRRVLNWRIDFDGTTAYPFRLLTPESDSDSEAANYIPDLDTPEEIYITSNGTWIPKISKYYNIYCTGKGGDGGAITTLVSFLSGGSGGGGGAFGFIRKYIEAGTTWTATFSASSSGNCTFSDGITTLTFQNGGDANAYAAGIGGATITGFDISTPGGEGGQGEYNVIATGRANGGIGGNCAGPFSIFGSSSSQSTSAAKDGKYGGGGGGAYHDGSSGGSAGVGGGPLIRIIG